MKLSLHFNGSMIRSTIIYSLVGFLSIFWLLPTMGLRGVECLTPAYQKPVNCFGNANFELVMWGITLLLIGWELASKRQFKAYLQLWKRLWLVIPFLLLALVSALWSIAPVVTIERSLILIAATASAVFIALMNSPRQWIGLLAVYFGIIIALSFLLIFAFPEFGRMLNRPYNGAWSGIFWHRNYLGSFMAFTSTLFLFRLLFPSKVNLKSSLLDGLGLAASIGLVFGSRSGAGILTLAALVGLTVLVFAWIKLRARLKTWHYLVFAAIVVFIAVFAFTNLDFIFGLVNRNTSLTGRIPMWKLLFSDYISNRLLFGHGYAAFWTFAQIRTGIQEILSWGYPVLIGDNGFIDILLHLGILGTVLMIGIFIQSFISAGSYAFRQKTGIAFFPLITLVYTVMANISLSMLIELEYLVWILLLVSLLVSGKTLSIEKQP